MKEELLRYALEKLRATESGEIITVHELVGDFKGLSDDIDTLLWLNKNLLREAKKEKLYLESAYGDVIVGMSYSVPYIVRRKYDMPDNPKAECVSIKLSTGGYLCIDGTGYEVFRNDVDASTWTELMSIVFDRCKVQNWYDTYIDCTILDGYYWDMEITLADGRVFKYSGSNKEPRGMRSLEKALGPWSNWAIRNYNFISNEDD